MALKQYFWLLLFLIGCASAQAQFDFSCAPFMAITKPAASGGGGATFVRVQFTNLYTGNILTVTNTTGNTLIVMESGAGLAATATIADTQLNTYVAQTAATVGTTGKLFSWVATNIAAGGSDVITVTTTLTDKGIAYIEYSGVKTADGSNSAPSGTSVLSTTNTTAGTDMVVTLWADENAASFTTNVLNPGNVPGVEIHYQSNHKDRQLEMLNGGAGFAAGTYTNTITNTAVSAGMTTIFLR